jgi:large subunit ribosomal protein L18
MRRKKRVRARVFGTPECPRLSVFRSIKNIYVQLIDDTSGSTVCSANTRMKAVSQKVGYGGNVKAAKEVGLALALSAKEKGIERVVFDRSGYRYHGRIKAVADAAREGGMKF